MPAAEIRTYADLVRALRARKEQLDLSYVTIEAVGGLTPGYASKLLSPRASKGFGEVSLALVLQVLGLKLLLVEDEEGLARIRPRLVKRYRAGVRHAVRHARPVAHPDDRAA
jgi:hypothetical protein